MTSTAVNNVAAIVAAVGVAEEPTGSSQQSRRRSYTVKAGGGRGADSASVGKPNSINHAGRTRGNDDVLGGGEPDSAMDESAVVDGLAGIDSVGSMAKARARRASEGSYLSRNEGKKSNGELRCEKCGKGYKHSSCLTKHLLVSLAKHLFYTPRWLSLHS